MIKIIKLINRDCVWLDRVKVCLGPQLGPQFSPLFSFSLLAPIHCNRPWAIIWSENPGLNQWVWVSKFLPAPFFPYFLFFPFCCRHRLIGRNQSIFRISPKPQNLNSQRVDLSHIRYFIINSYLSQVRGVSLVSTRGISGLVNFMLSRSLQIRVLSPPEVLITEISISKINDRGNFCISSQTHNQTVPTTSEGQHWRCKSGYVPDNMLFYLSNWYNSWIIFLNKLIWHWLPWFSKSYQFCFH